MEACFWGKNVGIYVKIKLCQNLVRMGKNFVLFMV